MENNDNNNKMIKCKSCGKDIAASAKACPHCGAPTPKPIHKRVWFWFVIILSLLGYYLVALENKQTEELQQTEVVETTVQETKAEPTEEPTQAPTEAPITYEKVTADDLINALRKNALKAEKQYNQQYVELTGTLVVIDSDGEYISLSSIKDEFCLDSILCNITSEEQLNKVLEMEKDDVVTVRGKITSIGEIMGYSIKIDEIL